MQFTFRTEVETSFEETIERITAALKEQGFGILTEIDVQATFKEKLDVDVPPEKILGACNPQLAHRALSADARVAALLPCNVVVRIEGDRTIVEALDPHLMAEVTGVDALADIAVEASHRLRAALEAVAIPGSDPVSAPRQD